MMVSVPEFETTKLAFVAPGTFTVPKFTDAGAVKPGVLWVWLVEGAVVVAQLARNRDATSTNAEANETGCFMIV